MTEQYDEYTDDDEDPTYYYDGYLKKKVEAAVFPWNRLKVIALDKYYRELQTRVNCFSRLGAFDKEFAAVYVLLGRREPQPVNYQPVGFSNLFLD